MSDHRKSAQCKLKTTIDLEKAGPCVKDPCENVECPAHQECLASFDGASARCACKVNYFLHGKVIYEASRIYFNPIHPKQNLQ